MNITPGTDSISTGTLTTSGTNVVINITSASPLVATKYPLIQYTNLSGDGFAAFSLAPVTGVIESLSNNASGGVIYLDIIAIVNTLTWYGSINANWDTSTLNWNSGATNYQQYVGGVGDFVTFDDTLYTGGPNPPSTNINVTPRSVRIP